MTERAVVFDVMGTLLDLGALRKRLTAIGAPEGTLEAWFGRTLHGATSLTLSGAYAPFAAIARPMLASTLAQLGIDPGRTEEVVPAFAELEAFPDAEPALGRLASAGIRIWTLTNGDEEQTRVLLERAGLLRHVEQVATVAAVKRYKPHPDVYRYALRGLELEPGDACMVAAHAWDVVGAAAVGMRAIWIDRIECVWPLPQPETERVRSLEDAAEQLLAG